MTSATARALIGLPEDGQSLDYDLSQMIARLRPCVGDVPEAEDCVTKLRWCRQTIRDVLVRLSARIDQAAPIVAAEEADIPF